ncbi:MAG: YafY family transcriptional regulator [Alphaproteobacteria bacterium]|nr:YafY family transcriptional regulator [Alphaproteobacteria bacterium]
MLASRLLSILMLLQTRGRMSASALAKAFEVSVRTIHRDIDQLSAAGVPVFAERGRDGGFALMDGYRTTLTGLTPPEAETLFLAGLPGPAAQLGLADTLAAARLKVMAALPKRMNPERIAARFHLDPVGWFHGAEPLPSLKPVAQAVWSGQYLALDYRRAGQSSLRALKLGPLGLVLKGGIWYLVAQNGKAVRTYRVSNIADARVLDEEFAHAPFDLPTHWERASRDYIAGLYRESAQVRVTRAGLAKLETLGPFVAQAAAKSARKPDKHGWMRCTIPIESTAVGARDLLRLGEEVEIVGPPALRKAMVRTLSAMLHRHR